MTESSQPLAWRSTARQRLVMVALVFGLWVVGIEARLVVLQVVQHNKWVDKAKDQQQETDVLPAQRGDILDCNGRTLATTIDSFSVVANPAYLKSIKISPETAAAELCNRLGDCHSVGDWGALVDLLKSPDPNRKGRLKRWVPVRHRLTEAQARRFRMLRMRGVELEWEPRRWYPNRELAANVLGYVGQDVGLAGVESRFDADLRGKAGTAIRLRDGKGLVFSAATGAPPVPGKTLELTIDIGLQHIAERELKAGVIENEAVSGAAIVANPMTGEIYAMASYPTYNPNSYALYAEEWRKNRPVQETYEPGSTFKIVTASAALDNGVIRPETLVDTLNGSIAIPGRRKTVRDTSFHGVIPFTDVIVMSSNVGAIRVGQRVGRERLGDYVRRFGFGGRVGADITGEQFSYIPKADSWSESTLASVSMGYEISVTPLQMLVAASAVANGGFRIVPHIRRATIDGNRRTLVNGTTTDRIMSEKTAAELATMMEGVVERGTARRAQIPGFTVAGKTGTAQKNANGHYLDGEYNASFVGFVPSRRPELVAIVVIDTPRGKMGHQGGRVAAPIFQRIIEAALKYRGVLPTVNPTEPLIVQQPRSYERLVSGAPGYTIAPAAPRTTDGSQTMPDVRGYSGRAAVAALAKFGLSARLSGDGLVSDQEPAPGEAITPGGSCRLVLTRQTREITAGHRP